VIKSFLGHLRAAPFGEPHKERQLGSFLSVPTPDGQKGKKKNAKKAGTVVCSAAEKSQKKKNKKQPGWVFILTLLGHRPREKGGKKATKSKIKHPVKKYWWTVD